MSEARHNNFNLIRAAAALAVLVSHAWPIAVGLGTIEPLQNLLGINLGELAVVTFFAVSGYFISQSFTAKSSVGDFVVARVLRIYPGLFVALVFAAVVLGPIFTTLPLSDYLSDPQAMLYVPRNLRLWPMAYPLPGVFDGNPFPQAVNGSLWTLAYEVACYGMVFVAGVLGFLRSGVRFGAVLVAYAVLHAATLAIMGARDAHAWWIVRHLTFLSFPFILGMALQVYRAHLPLRWPVLLVLAVAAAASHGQPWFQHLFIIAWSYAVFWLGFARIPLLDRYNRLGDYSYGIYIYAFPIEQAVAAAWRGCSITEMIVASLPITVVLAVLSWHLVEKRAIGRRKAMTRRLESWVLSSGNKPAA